MYHQSLHRKCLLTSDLSHHHTSRFPVSSRINPQCSPPHQLQHSLVPSSLVHLLERRALLPFFIFAVIISQWTPSAIQNITCLDAVVKHFSSEFEWKATRWGICRERVSGKRTINTVRFITIELRAYHKNYIENSEYTLGYLWYQDLYSLQLPPAS